MYRIASLSGHLLSGKIATFGEAQEIAEELELELDLVCVIEQFIAGGWVRADAVIGGAE
jgi:hypothetical protein